MCQTVNWISSQTKIFPSFLVTRWPDAERSRFPLPASSTQRIGRILIIIISHHCCATVLLPYHQHHPLALCVSLWHGLDPQQLLSCLSSKFNDTGSSFTFSSYEFLQGFYITTTASVFLLFILHDRNPLPNYHMRPADHQKSDRLLAI